jgi:hypothetical protein
VRKLAIEALAILGVTAGAAVAVYFLLVHHSRSSWRFAGTQVQDVTRAIGIQTEVSVAIDPSNPRVVFAASNDSLEPALRVYTSTNGGRTWTSSPRGPLFDSNTCAWGDPSVAVAPDGREYVAYTEKSICAEGPDQSPYLVVGSRNGPRGRWIAHRVTRPALQYGFDDKPAIAVARNGTVYVAWSRLLRPNYQTTVLASSTDGGTTWSSPRPVDPGLVQPQLVTIAAGPDRTLYIAGVDARYGIWIGRSTDGGRRVAVRQAAPLTGNQAATCIAFGGHAIPQQAIRCLGPNPTVTVSGARVFVTYAATGRNLTQDVHVAVFDRALRPIWSGPVGVPDKGKVDQFWPASATDPRTGDLWACFYDTSGDSSRKEAWFSCTISRDGRHWATPVRPALASSSAEVLWEDARLYGFGDSTAFGGYPAVAVAGGIAHPMWTDTRDLLGRKEEIYSATLPATAFGR